MFDLIVVPLDGSAAAEAALAYAELIPSRRVRLLSVEPDAAPPLAVEEPVWGAWRSHREREVRAFLERAAEPLRRQGRVVETVVAFGDPAGEIVAAATPADLIVMGSHGRGAGDRLRFGSVADRVARHAAAPTLVVRGGARPAAAPPLERLVGPLDGSPLAERALPVAAALAGDLGRPVHLIRVVDVDALRAAVQAGTHAAAAYARSQEVVCRQAEEYLAAQAQHLRDRDLAATTELRTGPPAAELLAAIQPGDLVVLTTHGRGGLRRWLLGSVAEKLVRLAAAPVLLMRSAAPAAE
jgi:nucleotide-binding universal stress UspA family protein